MSIEEPTQEDANALSQELSDLIAMEQTKGWEAFESVIKASIAEEIEFLVRCKPEDVARTQGKIAALRWMMLHRKRVEEKLDGILTDLRKAETQG